MHKIKNIQYRNYENNMVFMQTKGQKDKKGE